MSEIENQRENHEILDNVASTPGELAAEARQEAAMTEAQSEAGKGKKRRKKKSTHDVSANETLASLASEIEWNEATADLSFIDEAQRESEAVNHFEELARRVAETVSRNQGQQEQVVGQPGGLDVSELCHELVAREPSIAEMIAAELDATADGIADTSAEIHAEMLASAVEEDVSEDVSENDDVTGEAMIAAAAEGFDIDAELGEASEADRPAEQMEFAALEEELGENDAAQEPQEFIDSDQLISIIESLLFSTDKPVSIATIKQIFKNSNVRTKDITRAMDILASEYASSQRGVTLEEINGGYQLRTKSDNTEFLRRLAKVRPFRLSGPALEVLSIVAYKQPVSKHEIDEIRGVESGHLVRALMERGLMCFNGKSENLPGKPMTYGTTRKFLETFGLRNLKELPTLSEIDEILPEGIGEEVEKETLSELTDRMSTELTSTYSEGEDELMQINAQLAQVDTTSEFFEQEKQRERDRRDRERAQDIRERIVVGDNVDEKDKKWLDRYEAKLLAQDQAAQAGIPVAISAEDAAGVEPAIGEELSALSDEAQASADAAAQEAAANVDEDDELALGADEAAFADNDLSEDDLVGNPDWDEDKD